MEGQEHQMRKFEKLHKQLVYMKPSQKDSLKDMRLL